MSGNKMPTVLCANRPQFLTSYLFADFSVAKEMLSIVFSPSIYNGDSVRVNTIVLFFIGNKDDLPNISLALTNLELPFNCIFMDFLPVFAHAINSGLPALVARTYVATFDSSLYMPSSFEPFIICIKFGYATMAGFGE